jgi:hypothetical protein
VCYKKELDVIVTTRNEGYFFKKKNQHRKLKAFTGQHHLKRIDEIIYFYLIIFLKHDNLIYSLIINSLTELVGRLIQLYGPVNCFT